MSVHKDSTTESRKEFRLRIDETAERAFQLSPGRWVDEALADTAEAVYAQALRDVLAHCTGMTISDEVGGQESCDKMLADFAAERGIDLEATDDTA